MRSVLKGLYENFEQYFCAVLIIMMVFCLGAQVFFRYVLGSALSWTEELSRFVFVWAVYLGASMAAKERSHIRVTAPQLLLPKKYRPFSPIFADAIWVAFNLIFAYVGVKQVHHMFRFKFISPALQWNTAYIYIVIPAGFAFMAFRIVEGYIRTYLKGGSVAVKEMVMKDTLAGGTSSKE